MSKKCCLCRSFLSKTVTSRVTSCDREEHEEHEEHEGQYVFLVKGLCIFSEGRMYF